MKVLLLSLAAAIFLISCGDDEPKQNTCNETISLSDDIMPIVNTSCIVGQCHQSGAYDFTSESNVIAKAESILTQVASSSMPPGEPLTSDLVKEIRCWVEAGAMDN